MRVEVISTGTELLRGRNIDTHLSWMARELDKVGLEVRHHQAVDDDFGRLVDALKLAAARSDAVLLTGGLGPTDDDYTRPAAEKAFHRPLVYRAGLWKEIRDRFRRFQIRLSMNNKRQAYVPKGATVLRNPEGTAPGFVLREHGVTFFAMPGPPREMYPMFRRHVLPRLRAASPVASWEGKAFGVPEGTVDETVGRLVGTRASYGLTVRQGQVTITLRAEGSRRRKTLADLSRRIRRALGDAFMDADLPDEVARLLAKTGTTIAVAESCTGGLITHKLTDVAGISEVLLESAVTYSNAAKIRRLGVDPDLIERYGAVSEEVARAMALGVARTSGATMGVAVTGIAGPGGGSAKKPVGLCYMAVDDWVVRRVFPGERSNVKERAAGVALNMARLKLLRGEGHARKTVGVRRAR